MVKALGGGVGAKVSTNEIDDNAVTLAKTAHGTQGGILIYGAAGAPTEAAVGTSGHVLTAKGAGASAVFEAAAGGLWTEVSTGTGSAVSAGTYAGFTSLSQYDWLKLLLKIETTATANSTVYYRLNSDNGAGLYEHIGGNTSAYITTSAAQIQGGRTNTANEANVSILTVCANMIYNPGWLLNSSPVNTTFYAGIGSWEGTGPITAIEFTTSGGTSFDWTAAIWGKNL